MPVRITGREKDGGRPDEGPAAWFVAQMESAYARLEPATGAPAREAAPAGLPRSGSSFESRLVSGAGEASLASPDRAVWIDRLRDYKQRKAAAAQARAAVRPGAPTVPGGRNWLPLGPTVVLHGQTVGDEPVGGRTVGIAVAKGGRRVYAATACGGVFRSDDGGTSWASMMEGFDLDPANFASASLACGAIAIDPMDPDRVYVGTGEGETYAIFSARIVSALPA
jgi:hypothetical protein